jgi:hypothetical protein
MGPRKDAMRQRTRETRHGTSHTARPRQGDRRGSHRLVVARPAEVGRAEGAPAEPAVGVGGEHAEVVFRVELAAHLFRISSEYVYEPNINIGKCKRDPSLPRACQVSSEYLYESYAKIGKCKPRFELAAHRRCRIGEVCLYQRLAVLARPVDARRCARIPGR